MKKRSVEIGGRNREMSKADMKKGLLDNVVYNSIQDGPGLSVYHDMEYGKSPEPMFVKNLHQRLA